MSRLGSSCFATVFGCVDFFMGRLATATLERTLSLPGLVRKSHHGIVSAAKHAQRSWNAESSEDTGTTSLTGMATHAAEATPQVEEMLSVLQALQVWVSSNGGAPPRRRRTKCNVDTFRTPYSRRLRRTSSCIPLKIKRCSAEGTPTAAWILDLTTSTVPLRLVSSAIVLPDNVFTKICTWAQSTSGSRASTREVGRLRAPCAAAPPLALSNATAAGRGTGRETHA